MFTKKVHVRPTCVGYLFVDNKHFGRLEAGVRRVWSFRKRLELVELPLRARQLVITNQDVLSKDGIAFRGSFTVEYRISDPDTTMATLDLSMGGPHALAQLEQRIHLLFQGRLRSVLAALTSEEAFEKRVEMEDLNDSTAQEAVRQIGVEIVSAQIRDLTFPKNIQDLFSRPLEAKIRAKADLENARTAVAAARALKNAAEIIRGDESVRFMQYLELLEKISTKGKHTFIVGDVASGGLKLRE